MMVICVKQHLSNIWSSFIKKLSNTETGLKKGVTYEKACISGLFREIIIYYGCIFAYVFKERQFQKSLKFYLNI